MRTTVRPASGCCANDGRTKHRRHAHRHRPCRRERTVRDLMATPCRKPPIVLEPPPNGTTIQMTLSPPISGSTRFLLLFRRSPGQEVIAREGDGVDAEIEDDGEPQ